MLTFWTTPSDIATAAAAATTNTTIHCEVTDRVQDSKNDMPTKLSMRRPGNECERLLVRLLSRNHWVKSPKVFSQHVTHNQDLRCA
mmetsp:Transcript_34384/g.111890  ORF Transcript_34384/g.111890 Transcript_34384/m.111890 type:complete len:86 (+) Transcript_34384:2985-3242(+)